MEWKGWKKDHGQTGMEWKGMEGMEGMERKAGRLASTSRWRRRCPGAPVRVDQGLVSTRGCAAQRWRRAGADAPAQVGEVAGVGGRRGRGAGTLQQGASAAGGGLVAADQFAHVFAAGAVATLAHLLIDIGLRLSGERCSSCSWAGQPRGIGKLWQVRISACGRCVAQPRTFDAPHLHTATALSPPSSPVICLPRTIPRVTPGRHLPRCR